jgi:N-carbamoyl-L-amino-acid hydrolase
LTFDSMWRALQPVGRNRRTGGYRRYAWTAEDATLAEWFASEAAARGLDVTVDRAGNQWAWWGQPDRRPGVVLGSHLDSVPDGGAFDGPLGVISAFAALDEMRARCASPPVPSGPSVPIGIARFVDEEGARFGVACAGSRMMTGALDADRARSLRDDEGVTMAEAMAACGHDAGMVGPDPEAMARMAAFVELHVEQGRALADGDASVAVASSIWPHGRWRLELAGEANHAGTTRLEDRRDPTLRMAGAVLAARHAAHRHGCVATVGKLIVEPNGVNAIPSKVTAWLDARGPLESDVRAVAAEVGLAGEVEAVEESFTAATTFDPDLRDRIARALGGAPALTTGAGHDAGVLAAAGVSAAMLFVRNPTGVSHSPAEHAERSDCLAGVDALARVLLELTGARSG